MCYASKSVSLVPRWRYLVDTRASIVRPISRRRPPGMGADAAKIPSGMPSYLSIYISTSREW